MTPTESAYAGEHTDCYRDKRLHIIIYTHHRGTQGALSYHSEYIAQVGAYGNDISSLEPCRRGHGGPWYGRHMTE